MLRCLQPITSSAILATPARNLFRPRPSVVSSNFGALTQVAFKVTTVRDPDRPKLPHSAYLRFAADYRAKHGLKGGRETMSQIGVAWKNASPVDKAPFEQEHAKENEVYQKAFQEYKDSGKLDAWKRDPAAPKRPLTPYFEWSAEKRKEARFNNMSVTEVAKTLKPEWEAVPVAQKEALKSRYTAEMETYKKQKEVYDASSEKRSWLEKTGRMKAIQEAEAKKDKDLSKKAEAKAKAQAKKAKTKAQAKKEAAKLKAAKKREADKLKAEKKKTQAAAKKAKEAEKKAAQKAKEQAAAKKAKEAEKKAAQKEKEAARKAKEAQKKAAEKEKLNARKAKEAQKKAAEKEKLKVKKAKAKAKSKK